MKYGSIGLWRNLIFHSSVRREFLLEWNVKEGSEVWWVAACSRRSTTSVANYHRDIAFICHKRGHNWICVIIRVGAGHCWYVPVVRSWGPESPPHVTPAAGSLGLESCLSCPIQHSPYHTATVDLHFTSKVSRGQCPHVYLFPPLKTGEFRSHRPWDTRLSDVESRVSDQRPRNISRSHRGSNPIAPLSQIRWFCLQRYGPSGTTFLVIELRLCASRGNTQQSTGGLGAEGDSYLWWKMKRQRIN